MAILKLFRKLAILAVLASATFAYAKPARPTPTTAPAMLCIFGNGWFVCI